MNPYLITIDGGTTNTRMALWHGDTYLCNHRSSVGVSVTATTGSHDAIQKTVSEGLCALIDKAKISFSDVTAIIASGMITSELGLMEVPHVAAPVSTKQLADAMVRTSLSKVIPSEFLNLGETDIPLWFIPGIKNFSGDSFESMDMMRGEETETVAVLNHDTYNNNSLFSDRPLAFEDYSASEEGFSSQEQDRVLILPGSHTKFVAVNAKGEITGCLTSIAGELLFAITCHTILQDAVHRHFTQADEYNKDAVMSGYLTAREVGLSRALFSGRILSRFAPAEADSAKAAPAAIAPIFHGNGAVSSEYAVSSDPVWLSNYLMGAVFSEDVQALKHSSAIEVSPETRIVISGKSPFRETLRDILLEDGMFSSVEVLPEPPVPLAAEGAKLLFELKTHH